MSVLVAGSRLGPYEILAPLGAGGMGEVYRARDTRLGRDVAIKVLPQHLSSNPEIRTRFEREAKTISSLNHPNICTLHDVGREGDTDYLVMELVEGETLAERLRRGALPAPDVLKFGAQIANALDRAHRAGVVHRDLKPGNVMLTKSGAKLMDFGLARATGVAGRAGGSGSATVLATSQTPTMAAVTAPLTAEGSIVGTFQYMSPEQLEGKETDARSDIWALGCVLYEMATGKRAFDGATQASLISSIMRDQPTPLGQVAPMSPPALERVVGQCLAKDPDERWQSAGDVRRELEWIAGGSGVSSASSAGMAAVPRRRGMPAWVPGVAAGVAIALAALLAALGPWRPSAPERGLVRFTIPSPPGAALAYPAEAELSPDCRNIVFVAGDSLNNNQLYLRPLASAEARPIPGTAKGGVPFWSPDSRTIGFFADGKLRKVALDGSPPVDLCDAPDPRGGAWSSDGTILFAPNNQGGLVRVPAGGGTPTPVTTPDASKHERGHRYPQFLPDGRHFLFVAITNSDEVSTYVASLDGGKPSEVARGGTMTRWTPQGELLYVENSPQSSSRRLLARRFDAGAMRATGDPQLVLDRVGTTNFGYTNASTGKDGTLITQHFGNPHVHLDWVDLAGRPLGVAIDDFDSPFANLSPDAKRIGYAGPDLVDLYVRDLASGVSTRLTFAGKQVGNLVWSPDGRRIAYSVLSGNGGWEAHLKAADGTGPDSLLFHGPGLFSYPESWSRDGRWLTMRCTNASGNFDIWVMPMDGSGKAHPYQETPASESNSQLSPDDRWMAYTAAEGGHRGLYVQSFPTPGAKYQITVDHAGGVGWNLTGDALVLITDDQTLMRYPVSTANGLTIGPPTRMCQIRGPTFLMDADVRGKRLLTGKPKDLAASTWLEVVLDWPALLQRP